MPLVTREARASKATQLPSLAQRTGSGTPGPAIHGRSFGSPRGSAA